ncbi:MAG: hypothetical protein AAF211_08290 [Myxococcota bacterium]
MSEDDKDAERWSDRISQVLTRFREAPFWARAREWVDRQPPANRLAGGALLAVLFVGLVWIVWPFERGDETPCATSGGHLGFVAVSDDLTLEAGQIWRVSTPTPVVAGRGSRIAVCVLGAGTEVVVLNDTIETGAERWVSIHAEAILTENRSPADAPAPVDAPAPADAPAAPAPTSATPASVSATDEPSPSPRGVCPGATDEIVGYARVSPFFAVGEGKTWTVQRDRVVRGGYPARANGFREDFAEVCRISKGADVVVRTRPIRTYGRGTWLPIYAGTATR